MAIFHLLQERMIKRGGVRACNFRRFLHWQNNPRIERFNILMEIFTLYNHGLKFLLVITEGM